MSEPMGCATPGARSDIGRISELERQLAEAQAEIERLQDIVGREPHSAYLEAVQRACDERLVTLKHEKRGAEARAEAAERTRDELREQLEAMLGQSSRMGICQILREEVADGPAGVSPFRFRTAGLAAAPNPEKKSRPEGRPSLGRKRGGGAAPR
jgi:hypothetical protein